LIISSVDEDFGQDTLALRFLPLAVRSAASA
jgi:hypothetical protein